MKTKTRFRIALAIRSDRKGEQVTAREFAKEHDCSITMLYGVLRGSHTSARLQKAVEEFIAREAEAAQLDLGTPDLATA